MPPDRDKYEKGDTSSWAEDPKSPMRGRDPSTIAAGTAITARIFTKMMKMITYCHSAPANFASNAGSWDLPSGSRD